MKTIKTIILSLTCLAMVSCDFLDKEPTKLIPDLCIRPTDLTELLRKRIHVHDGC